MPGSSRKVPAWLPILVILIAMVSIQSGASLAKSLFPLIGAPGVTALRLTLGTLILVVIFKPWRLRFAPQQRLPLFFYGVALGAMNYLFYLSLQRIPLGVAVALEFTGPLAVALFGSRRPLDFVWVALAVLGLWFLLPLGQNVGEVDLVGALFALGAGAFWAVYILTGQRAGEEHGPATVAMGSLIAAVIFVPIGVVQASDTLLQWSLLPLGLGIAILSTALPYSAGNDRLDPDAHPYLRHADEHGAGAGGAVGNGVPRRDANPDANSGVRGDYHRLNGLNANHATAKQNRESRYKLRFCYRPGSRS